MLDPIQIEIHIEQRPKKMLAVMKFDRKQLVQRRFAKPGELPEVQKIFPASNEKPKTMR